MNSEIQSDCSDLSTFKNNVMHFKPPTKVVWIGLVKFKLNFCVDYKTKSHGQNNKQCLSDKLSVYINLLYSCYGKAAFSATITPVISVT